MIGPIISVMLYSVSIILCISMAEMDGYNSPSYIVNILFCVILIAHTLILIGQEHTRIMYKINTTEERMARIGTNTVLAFLFSIASLIIQRHQSWSN